MTYCRNGIGAVIALFLALAAFGADESNAPVPKPEVKVGDRWTYRLTDYPTNLPRIRNIETRVTFVGPDEILTVNTDGSGNETESHWTSEWNTVSSASGEVFDPPQRLLKFPLQVGATYPYAFERVATRGSPARYRSEGVVNVVGWVDIVVAAGKFRALKVEANGTWQRLDAAGGGWQRRGIWYVPEVKRLVKFTTESGTRGLSTPDTKLEIELVEFKIQ